ncbi:MAG: stage III sporulation protein AD [Clostridiales bacterium]|nr:stage III sporulation protein AD [Clostridiales bacterium]MCF8021171.1 stage III sporulation protein AD [Clostridiales bacterium]
MEIISIVGLAMVAAVMGVMLRQSKPEMAVILSIVVGIVIFTVILGKIGSVFDILRQLAAKAEISNIYLGTILKIVGIAYIADFGAQICRDAGEGAVATKIELAAKIIVLVLAVPIVVTVLQSLLKLVP